MVAAVKITSDKGDLLESKGHYNDTPFMTYLAELAESIGSEWAVAKYFGLPFDPFEDKGKRKADVGAGIEVRWTKYELGQLIVYEYDRPNDIAVLVTGTAPNYFKGASYNGGKFGYGRLAGTGASVTQTTDKGTGVTIDKVCGKIITHAAALNAATSVFFQVINSEVAATDVIILNIASGPATKGTYQATVDAVGAGSFYVHLRNVSAGSLSEAISLNFAVIRAVQS